MPQLGIVTGSAVHLLRPGRRWHVETVLPDQSPECIAVDPGEPSRIYVGTLGSGVWRSLDAGRTWEPAGSGIGPPEVTALAVAPGGGMAPGRVFVGTEPSTIARSDDAGTNWETLDAFAALPSSSTWSFPPRPETHHVRWIQPDPVVAARVYVAVEAGALVRTLDGGDTWLDHQRRGPIDTHTAACHRLAEGRLVSAAGDGYFETDDGGETWRRPMAGLDHGYLVGVAMDPADPDTVVVSATAGPYLAYRPRGAEAFIYLREGKGRFKLAMDGLPEPAGTVASRLTPDPARPGVIYAANNRGLFRTDDGGRRWAQLEIPFPSGALRSGVRAAIAFEA